MRKILSTYHQDNFKEYCEEYGIKPKATDILCAKIMDSGLDIGWRPGMDFKVIRKTTGCEGRLALHYRHGWRGYKDCEWTFNGRTGSGIDLMRKVSELVKFEKLEISKSSADSFIWIDALEI